MCNLVDGEVVPIPTFPLESTRTRSVPLVETAMLSAAGKNNPLFVSPVGTMAGAAAVPVPLVMRVVDTRVGIVPVVIVAAVEVVVPAVSVGIRPVVIVPFVKFAAVPVVVPMVRFGITPVVNVPEVNVAAVPMLVPSVTVAIVPLVELMLPVISAFIKLSTVMRFRLLESEASPINTVSLDAITVSDVLS